VVLAKADGHTQQVDFDILVLSPGGTNTIAIIDGATGEIFTVGDIIAGTPNRSSARN